MKTKSRPVHRLRQAMQLLFATGMLLGLWAAGNAHAQQKKDLIEIPLIKQFKAEKAAAAAEAAASGSGTKHGGDKPAAKEETVAPTANASHGAKKTDANADAAHATDPKHGAEKTIVKEEATSAHKPSAEKSGAEEKAVPTKALTGAAASESVKQLREALSAIGSPAKPVTSAKPAGHRLSKLADAHGTEESRSNRAYQRARALALARGEPMPPEPGHAGHGGEVHWAYEGENGPPAWGSLKPEFNLCAIGKRQSPIAIRDEATLRGPAEGIQFHYTPSTGAVVNNGHTIQVDVEGDNSITVRNSTYKLVQFHFHTPSEEMINSKRYAMVAHLVHKNEAGQLAVVAVLLEQGEANPLIDTVWTYLPLDTNDRVRMPAGVIDMNEILPADQRYYQFLGSLTTPPCTEGVLWMVVKQPLRISPAQFKVFSQLFPFNARPVQPVNGRPVREAQ